MHGSTGPTPQPLTPSGTALLVRTDFGDDRLWRELLTAARTPTVEGFLPNLDVVDDRSYAGLDTDRLRGLYPDEHPGPHFFLVADHEAVVAEGHPVLVAPIPYPAHYLDWLHEPPRHEFRVVAAALWSVENNLSLANMDWHDFADSTDDDGVSRGF